MANFKTHITVSTGLGIAYGVIGYSQFQVPLGSCIIAGGLCGLAGMLPDLDSDSGIPVRETLAFTSAVIPMFMMERFERMGMSHASMILAGGALYFLLRFVVWEVFKRYTKHRGMWHSIPAAFIAAMVAFLVCSSPDISIRMFRSWAVFLGFMSHLVLDEIYAVDLNGRLVKKSFGTAMKFFGKSQWANITCYAKLLALGLILVNDPMVQDSMEQNQIALPAFAKRTIEVFQVKSVKEWLPHDHHTHEDFDQKSLLPIRRGPLTQRPQDQEPTMVVRWLNYLTGSTQEELKDELQNATGHPVQPAGFQQPATGDPSTGSSTSIPSTDPTWGSPHPALANPALSNPSLQPTPQPSVAIPTNPGW